MWNSQPNIYVHSFHNPQPGCPLEGEGGMRAGVFWIMLRKLLLYSLFSTLHQNLHPSLFLFAWSQHAGSLGLIKPVTCTGIMTSPPYCTTRDSFISLLIKMESRPCRASAWHISILHHSSGHVSILSLTRPSSSTTGETGPSRGHILQLSPNLLHLALSTPTWHPSISVLITAVASLFEACLPTRLENLLLQHNFPSHYTTERELTCLVLPFLHWGPTAKPLSTLVPPLPSISRQPVT